MNDNCGPDNRFRVGGQTMGGIDGYNEINIMVGSIATQRVLFDNEIVIMKSIVIKFRLEEE